MYALAVPKGRPRLTHKLRRHSHKMSFAGDMPALSYDEDMEEADSRPIRNTVCALPSLGHRPDSRGLTDHALHDGLFRVEAGMADAPFPPLPRHVS